MEENAALSAKSLIEQENRQYNETNALYHAAAVQFGLSDTAFWILYALYSSASPITQVQMCAEWCLPIARVVRAEAAAICRIGLERMETDLAIRQGYLQKLREEFTQLKEKTDGHKTENL